MAKKSNAIENLSSCVCYGSATLTARPGYSWGSRDWWLLNRSCFMPDIF